RQWMLCDVFGANCTNIPGATALTYTPSLSDVGSTLRLREIVSDAGGSITLMSDPSLAVVPLAPVNLTLPSIPGPWAEGMMLTANPGTWQNDIAPTITYGWQLCSTPTTCFAVANSAGPNLTVTATMVGKQLKVTVTESNAAGTARATSALTGVIT